MALQGELFPDPEVVITLDNARREPRVWVSRLVIWEKPGEILREVRLRRGLNVIWSPDPGANRAALGQDAGSGHGAGKTLFCRLLRYCLGEDSFSNDETAAEHRTATACWSCWCRSGHCREAMGGDSAHRYDQKAFGTGRCFPRIHCYDEGARWEYPANVGCPANLPLFERN